MLTLMKWSIEDYHRLIESGILNSRNVELIRGEIVEMSPESALHYMSGEEGTDYLKKLLQDRAYVRFNGAVTLADSEPQPDIAIVKLPKENYRQHHPFPEDIFWLVEISNSTLEKDLNQKQKIYSQAGIPEYWVLDIKARKIIIFRQSNGLEYLLKVEMNQGNISPLAFPDIDVSIDKLLETILPTLKKL